jgi:hypothetical protein
MMSDMTASMRVLIRLYKAIAIVLGAGGVCLIPCAAHSAGKYDGSSPFVCVPTAITECVSEGECRPGTAQSENLPEFFKVDLKQQTISSEDKKRLSSIKRVDRSASQIILYGTDSDRSWVLKIQEKTGRMSASVIGNGESFAIFGVCPSL